MAPGDLNPRRARALLVSTPVAVIVVVVAAVVVLVLLGPPAAGVVALVGVVTVGQSVALRPGGGAWARVRERARTWARASARAWAWLWGPCRRALARAARTLVVRSAPAAVGCLVVLVALDWAAGRLLGDEAEQVVVPGADLTELVLAPSEDPRADSAAYGGAPWVDRYFAELARVPYTYHPFVGPRDGAVHGRYVNTGDGIRRSYVAPGAAGPEAVTVWFFGGSTLWGEGQRDLHTIPSEVARLAEADGVALRVVNYGIRGYTAFQEFLVFEQELARRDPPDLAVFYHGANEIYSLLESPANLGPQPSIFQIEVLAEAFGQAPPLPQHPVVEPSVSRDYFETSVLNKALRAARGLVESPAGAAESAPEPPAERVWDPEAGRALTEATQIYRRSVALIEHTGDEHGVPTLLLWQPGSRPGANDLYEAMGDRVQGEHVDISDALADAPGPVYIDAVHTNELGARLAAEAVWAHLQPALRGVAR